MATTQTLNKPTTMRGFGGFLRNKRWQKALRLLTGTCVCALFSLGVYFLTQNFSWWESADKYADHGRNYNLTPFDINDAARVCTNKTADRFGDQLVRSYVDYHSTRYDARLAIYKVFMHAQLGDLYLHSDAPIHCFVDPKQHIVTHYRSFEARKSLMTRAISFISL
ncbi:hypothetical protein [Teredinibacter turnerae]|uniref:hypothetical protein n=1 Tax=Teredinibacter turnerae TaxID=2426 RepID=UPI0004150B99|nr:hypothetical protein [Teredinibacter turnerae]